METKKTKHPPFDLAACRESLATASGKLVVYGWSSFRHELPGRPQTREICAARSFAELCRIVEASCGKWHKPRRDYCGETGNIAELTVAMNEPGHVFFRDINKWDDAFTRATDAKATK